MRVSGARYGWCALLQVSLLAADAALAAATLPPRATQTLLLLCLLQDLLLVLSVTSMLMTLFSTYLFQAGLVGALVRQFGGAALLSGGYLLSCVCAHTALLLHAAPAPAALLLLLALQRCLSPWYYYWFKRAALRAADPRLYEDVDWLQRRR